MNIKEKKEKIEFEVTLKNDYLFKRLLGAEENKAILQNFLECVLKEPLIKARQCQRSVEAEHLTAVPATFSSCRKL